MYGIDGACPPLMDWRTNDPGPELWRAEKTLALAQGATYTAMGMWPLLNLRTFAVVTGPKPEGWLVKAVAGLLVAIGSSMVRGARSNERKSVSTVGAGAAVTLGSVALYYAWRRRISPIYVLDATVHLTFAAAWTGLLTTRALAVPRSATPSVR